MKNRITYFLWKWINSVYYSGNIVKCPLCNWNGSEFLNLRCPKCNSLARQRLVPYCINTFNLIDKRILHIGPNKSEYDYVLKKIDPEIYDRVALSKSKIVNLPEDITKKGLKLEYYDLIIIWHVLEHIKDDKKAIKNLFSSLRYGGKMLVSVPIHPEGNLKTIEYNNLDENEYENIYGDRNHVRSCGLDYIERITNIGFELIHEITVEAIDVKKIKYYGLSKNHIAWLCEKPRIKGK